MPQITNEIFDTYFDCPYKSYLIAKEIKGTKHDLEKINLNRIQEIKKIFNTRITGISHANNFNVVTAEIIKKGYDYIFDARFLTDEFDFHCDYLEKVDSTSKPGNYSYIPIIIIPDEKNIPSKIKILIAGIVKVLNEIQEEQTENGMILKSNTKTTVKSDLYIKEFSKTLKLIKSNISPDIFLNKNCNTCEFYNLCYEKASNADKLCILRGMPKKTIVNLNKKGIFTIHQFSFTFKPKKKQKSVSGIKLDYALKALALREKKTYIIDIPQLPKTETKIFIDIEGLNEQDFYYLISVHIESTNNSETFSFWSDYPNNAESEFIAFLNVFNNFDKYILYHYGSYDISALKKLNKQYNSKYSDQIESIIKNSFNILSLFSTHIYPPTYSNGLKEIANSIGFNWSSDKASGLQSIVWRKQWELTNDENLKQLLITYNRDDCFALKFVTEWISRIKIYNIENNDNFINVNSIKIETHLKWGKQKFVIPEFETINDYSYFDYQRSKIFFRTNKAIKKATTIRKNRKLNDKVNTIINYIPINCPMCNNSRFYTHNNNKAIVVDIKFTENGIKKWVIQFPAKSFECSNCNFIFRFNKYGRNLMIWVINQYVSYLTSGPKIINMLKEYFNIKIDQSYLYNFKADLAKEYLPIYNEIKETIFTGNLIHADESKTPVKGISNGYVWVFTSMDTVYYTYTHNREADFLSVLFINFKGVLVSDFYAGYYSLQCQQQKCLVHLIRDLNNDLLANQFNLEFKKLVAAFGILLKKMIETTDRHGLQKKYLQKHQFQIDTFYENIVNQDYESEIALSYKKRFIRNKDKLFTFINYDNVPWNNNNAENAIKPLAKYRSRAKGILFEKGLQDYLILLSIEQTCKYRGISFLDFLKSKKMSFKESE